MSFSGRDTTFSETVISNNGFFPDIELGEFQRLHRIPTGIADDAVIHQVTMAVGVVNQSLALMQAEWELLGFSTLQEFDDTVPESKTNFYKAAVYYRAKAKLLLDFQTFSRRAVADDQAKEAEDTEQRLMAESNKALGFLLGRVTTVGVELL